jgi:hypothetical protein
VSFERHQALQPGTEVGTAQQFANGQPNAGGVLVGLLAKTAGTFTKNSAVLHVRGRYFKRPATLGQKKVSGTIRVTGALVPFRTALSRPARAITESSQFAHTLGPEVVDNLEWNLCESMACVARVSLGCLR